MDRERLSEEKRSSKKRALRSGLTAGLLLVLSGACAFSAVIDDQRASSTQPPKMPTIVPAGEVTLRPGEVKAFQARSAGADRYEWKLHGEGGISDTRSPAIVFRAGRGGGSAVLSVTAHNAYGASPSAAVVVHVLSGRSIRLDALAIPAGWMANGRNPSDFISLGRGEQCRTGSPCLRITHRAGAGWAGIFWWPEACGPTGDEQFWRNARSGVCAVNLGKIGGFAQGHAKLSLWARGQRGGEVVSFKVGSHDLLPTPACSAGRLRLETDWKRYEIDLTTADLTRMVGLFAWTAADVDNPDGATFYLQDIQFEGD
jgi:hypothetical protein